MIPADGLQAVLNSFRDAVLVVDDRGRIACVNRQAEQLFQTPAERLVGTDAFDLMADRRASAFLDYLRQTLLSAGPAMPIELVGRQAGGALVPIEVTSGPIAWTEGPAFTLAIRDISGRKAKEKELRDGANRDRLTQVATRDHVELLAEAEIFRVSRYARPLSVLLFDIDRFKLVNDTYGHAAGDMVLREVATRCRSVVRGSDLIGRWGGEEFLVMTPETALDGGRVLGERLRRAVAEMPVSLESGNRLTVTISVGVASYCASDKDLGAIVRRADNALYRAKAAGRDRVEVAELPTKLVASAA